jgi:uncharacterized membrane protein
MKKVLLFLLALVCGFMELLEVLALPILFLILGLWQDLPWQYYAITIGGYFGLLLIGELVIHLIFRALERKYTSRIARKAEKYRTRFLKEHENSPDLTAEDN